MSQDEYQPPATVALAEFLDRIDKDDALPAAIKTAIREDLAAESPSSFQKLSAALTAENNKK